VDNVLHNLDYRRWIVARHDPYLCNRLVAEKAPLAKIACLILSSYVILEPVELLMMIQSRRPRSLRLVAREVTFTLGKSTGTSLHYYLCIAVAIAVFLGLPGSSLQTSADSGSSLPGHTFADGINLISIPLNRVNISASNNGDSAHMLGFTLVFEHLDTLDYLSYNLSSPVYVYGLSNQSQATRL
jgi:hypothetical protein